MGQTSHLYAIALGSNRRHGRHGAPDKVIAAALKAIEARGIGIGRRARTRTTAPVGPGGRAYANGAALITTSLAPPALLALFKGIERDFGRRRGRRWGARVLDIDIILWSAGRWRAPGLNIPHPGLAGRGFVLDPLCDIVPGWRLPGCATAVRHLRHRFRRGRPLRYPTTR